MIAVLGVVAAITVPKFKLMLHQSREGRTKASLGELRGAIAVYYSDNFGLYPSDDGTPETRLSSALVPAILPAMPAVDLPHHHSAPLNTVSDRVDDSGDWFYTAVDGFVGVNCTHLDTESKPISDW